MNYKNVNINKFINNIKSFKQKYNYQNYILNVSNNAFNNGIEIIKHLDNNVDYLYTINFKDIINIRKYNHDINIIYSGIITENNIYDLILNNASLVINSREVMNFILKLNIKEKFNIIFRIDKYSCDLNILNDIKNDKYINVLGVIIDEKDIDNSLLNNLKLIITNESKKKDLISNSIILDKSIYKEIAKVYTFLSNITKDYKYGIIPIGLVLEMDKKTKKVLINNKYYKVKEIKDEYTIIKINKSVNINSLVLVNSKVDNFSNLEISYKKD